MGGERQQMASLPMAATDAGSGGVPRETPAQAMPMAPAQPYVQPRREAPQGSGASRDYGSTAADRIREKADKARKK
jgi:hypothetical protein